MGQLKHQKLSAAGSTGVINGNYSQLQFYNDATDDATIELSGFGTVLIPAKQWTVLKASPGSFYSVLDILAGNAPLYYYLQN